MPKSNVRLSIWFRLTVFGLLIPLVGLGLLLLLAVDASTLQAAEPELASTLPVEAVDQESLVDGWQLAGPAAPAASAPAASAAVTPTTLSVTILSTPWAILDSNNPGGRPSDPGPNVFIVEAVVTNTGDYDAVDLEVTLDFNESPGSDWQLLPNEDPLRTPAGNLAPGEGFYAYWFASYPIAFNQGHQYTVTALAEQVAPVSTSVNAFETPSPGNTVATVSSLSTGSSGLTQINADIVVGVVYTITVDYDLGTDPGALILSPAGNPEFDAGSTRLLASSVRLTNDVDPVGETIADRLYLPTIPLLEGDTVAKYAEVNYTLLPVTPAMTGLCPFMAIDFGSNYKHDQFYCDPDRDTVIVIDGDLSFSMTKQVDADLVQQNGVLTYTINYTNNGTLPLGQVWLWDNLDPAVASVISGTAVPAADADESTAHRVAWFLGDLPAAGQPGSSGTLTFQALIDGAGLDLPDGTEAPNYAFFGVNPGSLPPLPALTATTTSTVQAPTISFSKSDGLDLVGNGQSLTYTINAANSGSVAATNLVLTDVLPAEITVTGTPSPAPDDTQGQTLVWTTLPDLAPGEMLTVTIPVVVNQDAPSFVDIVNQADFQYGNASGHTFDVETASDVTTGVRRAGFVDGYAFVDSAGDGVYDGDELPLSGVQVGLPAALTPTTTTDANGYYRFRVEVEQPVTVTAALPGGYFRTTPGEVLLDNTFEVTETVNFGYALTSSDFGVIYGVVFADHNHDGTQDGGEDGLPGVTISATAAVTSPVATSDFGIYTLRFNDPGTVSIEETNPPGYVSTTPDLLQTAVVTGSDNGSPLNFGDFLGIKIDGKVFDDLNVNGQDDGEAGLAGALVAAGSDSMTTAADGLYSLFVRVPGGPILISESDPAGYVSTDAAPGSGMSRVDPNTLSINSPVSGTIYQGGLFGDVLATGVITISGEVWDDNGAGGGLPANGQRDGLEPGLPGVWVSASSGMSVQTGALGDFTLYAPPGEPITVTEQNPAGYVSTNAINGNNALKIDDDTLRVSGLLAGGVSSGNQFGDVLETGVAAFSGAVWNDNGENGGVANDGLWQVGMEPPLAGATVSLSSGMSAPTGPDGLYLLYGPAGATITITEQNPAGHVSSGAIPGPGATYYDDDNLVVAAPLAGQAYASNFFGDLLPADLVIDKLDDPDPVTAGTLLTYTLNFRNDGPSYAQSVVISDVLPAGVTFDGVLSQPAELSGPVQAGSTLTWTAAALDNGYAGSIVFQVLVGSDQLAGHSLTNTVAIASNMPDLGPGSNTAQTWTTVDRRVDLALTKTGNPSSVVAGTSLTYRLEVTNNGPSDATGVVVSDTLPAEVSFISATSSQGTYSVTTGLWSVDELALNATATLTIEVDVASNASFPVSNWAEAWADQPEIDESDNTALEVTVITREVDLALTKSDDPDPVVAGEGLTYTLQLSNSGPSDATGVLVTDTLPADVSFVSYEATQGTFDDATGLWDVGGLALDATVTLTVEVVVSANAPVSLTNHAVATSEETELNAADNIATEVTGVTRQTDLAIAKSADPDPVAAGVPLTYTLLVSNIGPSYATGVTVTDQLPDSVSYQSDIASQGDYDPGSGIWTVGEMADGASATLDIVVTVKSGATVSVTNEASVSGEQDDPVQDNNTAQTTTTITTIVDLAISKGDDPDPATAGQQLTYSLQVDNNGPSDATGVSVADALPLGLSYASSGASQGAYDPGLGIWTVGELAFGQSATLTITADIDPGLVGTITNTATVSGDQFDPDEDDNLVDEQTVIIAVADMAISKWDSPDPVVAGTPLTYVIEVENLGPSDATGVSVSDQLPAGLTFQGYVASQGSYSETTGLWDTGLVTLNQTATLTITVLVDSDQLGSVDNTAVVSATPEDPESENDSVTVSTVIESQADLAITKSDAPDPVAAGGIVTYTLSYQNLGPSDALGLSIVDTLSDDVTFLEVIEENPATDSFEQDGQEPTWTLSSLAYGESGSIIFTVRVKPDVIGAVFNDVIISSETDDPLPGNNSAQSETAIGSPDQATIYGYVYDDANIDGVFDDDEVGISGVTLWLDDTYSTTTDAAGLFFFITDQAGTHKVTEVDPDGYFSTTSNKRVIPVNLGTSKRVDFGDASVTQEAAAIYGTVFNDENSNGLWEDDETGLPGVTITLDESSSTLTDIYGGYTFSTTATGEHGVVETDLPGYFSTTPNSVTVEVELKHGYEENFGDVLADIATCDPDSFEEDDVVGDAAALPVGETQRHDFCDDAVDWTVFTAQAGSIYTITTSAFDWRVDTNIALFDQDGQTLIAANDDVEGSTDFSSSLTWRASGNGDYFIRTSNMAAVTGRHTEYDLHLTMKPVYFQFLPIIMNSPALDKVSIQEKPFRHAGQLVDVSLPDPDSGDGGNGPLGIITHMCPDAYEVDDTWETAAVVEDGDVQIHSFDSNPILWAADKDYMGFMLLPHQTITFTVGTVTNTLTFMEAFDHEGRSLGVTGTDQLVLEDMQQGHYFISVSPLEATGYGCSDQVGYELTVDKSPRWARNLPIITGLP